MRRSIPPHYSQPFFTFDSAKTANKRYMYDDDDENGNKNWDKSGYLTRDRRVSLML